MKLRQLGDKLRFLVFPAIAVLFFWQFFFKGLLPIPADITVGVYYPWLDYKWGYVVGVPVKNPLPSDIPSLVYPWRELVVNQLKKGILPLWNPYYFGGMPLLANFQSATFSLANIFFLFLGQAKAWSFGVVIQPLLTGFFTFLFLKHLGLKKVSAIFGGIIFAFCGFNLMWLEYNVHGHTGMWLPILLLVVDKVLIERKWFWVFLGSLALAFQVFAGYPQIVLYSLTVAGFYAIFRLFFMWKAKRDWRALVVPSLLLFVFVISGLLLAAIQILPGIEALNLSVRKIDSLAESSSGGFLPWQNLITLLAPDFFGNPATYNFWGKPWYDNFVLYVGIAPLIFAFLAIFFQKNKISRFFIFLSSFALLLALPTPIGRWINDLGVYGVRGIPAKSIFILSFSLAVLAAIGFDWWIDDKKRKKSLPIFIFFTICFSAIWGFTLLANRFFPGASWLIYLGIAKRNLILPTTIFLALILTLATSLFLFRSRKTFLPKPIPTFIRLRRKPRASLGDECDQSAPADFAPSGARGEDTMGVSPWSFIFSVVPFAIICLTILDLFRFGWKYLSFSRQELIFPTTPVIEFLRSQEKPFRVEFGEAIPQNMWMPYGLESAAGYDAMAPLRFNQFLGAVRTGRADTPYGRVAQVENYDSPLFDLANIKYVLAVKYDERGIRCPEGKPREVFRRSKFKLVFEDKTVQVYENENVIPRVFIVHDYFFGTDSQEIIDKMLSPNFDLSKSVALEEELGVDEEKFNTKEDTAVYLKYEPKESVIRANTSTRSILVVTDSFYPGWKAFLDGKEVEVYRADFTFRAISLPPGEHLVRFIYDPQLFKIGIALSAVSLMGVGFGGLFIYRYKREYW